MMKALVDILEDMEFDDDHIPTQHCQRCNKDCPVVSIEEVSKNGLHIMVFGHTCKEFSVMNQAGHGGAGESAVVLAVVLYTIKKVNPHGWVAECTRLVDVDIYKAVLTEEDWIIEQMLLSPSDFGSPKTRIRSLSCGRSIKRAAMRKPFRRSNLSPFFRGTMMTGDSFWVAPETEVQQHFQEVAARRNLPSHGKISAFSLMNSGSFVHLMGHLEHVSEEMLNKITENIPGRVLSQVDLVEMVSQIIQLGVYNAPWNGIVTTGDLQGTVDVMQTSQRAQIAMKLGALLCGAEPFSLKFMRIQTPWETLFTMGVPLYEHCLPEEHKEAYKVPWRDFLPTLSESQVRTMSGNGMSFEVIGIVLGFMLSNLVVQSEGSCLQALHIMNDSDSE